MKKRFKILTILLFLAIIFTSLKVEASTNKYVYLGGDSIGIKMNTGVYVVGKYQVQNGKTKICPWEKSDIQNGDRIDSINGIKITNNAQLQKYIKETNTSTLKLKVKRGDKVFQTQINVVENNNQEKTIGLYIRDQILGIGTLTFITDDNKFASLGHGIYENKILVNTTSGNLYTSNVQTIKKSEPGSAGEKRASLDNQIIGKIIFNDVTGLYGTVNHVNQKKQKIEMVSQNEVKTGKLPFLLTSCCPAWSMLAKKTLPDMVETVSSALTPMVATARTIKQRHPEAKIVFVGPCAAKKLEASRRSVRSDVDFVITFEELDAIFTAKGIDMETYDAEEPIHDATGTGRGYAVAGGVANAIENCINEYYPGTEVYIEHAEGLSDCQKMLLMAKAGKKDGCLIEGMGCPGGCVAGAGTNIAIPKAAQAVRKFVKDSTTALPPKEYSEIDLP